MCVTSTSPGDSLGSSSGPAAPSTAAASAASAARRRTLTPCVSPHAEWRASSSRGGGARRRRAQLGGGEARGLGLRGGDARGLEPREVDARRAQRDERRGEVVGVALAAEHVARREACVEEVGDGDVERPRLDLLADGERRRAGGRAAAEGRAEPAELGGVGDAARRRRARVVVVGGERPHARRAEPRDRLRRRAKVEAHVVRHAVGRGRVVGARRDDLGEVEAAERGRVEARGARVGE